MKVEQPPFPVLFFLPLHLLLFFALIPLSLSSFPLRILSFPLSPKLYLSPFSHSFSTFFFFYLYSPQSPSHLYLRGRIRSFSFLLPSFSTSTPSYLHLSPFSSSILTSSLYLQRRSLPHTCPPPSASPLKKFLVLPSWLIPLFFLLQLTQVT